MGIGTPELIFLVFGLIFILFLIGMVILAVKLFKGRNLLNLKKCPYCAEMIQPEAIVCRYCGKDYDN